MGLLIFNGRGLSDMEIAMATPDISEAKDLELHVRKCAGRFRLLAEAVNALHSDVNQIKAGLVLVGGYLVLVSQPAQAVIGSLIRVFH